MIIQNFTGLIASDGLVVIYCVYTSKMSIAGGKLSWGVCGRRNLAGIFKNREGYAMDRKVKLRWQPIWLGWRDGDGPKPDWKQLRLRQTITWMKFHKELWAARQWISQKFLLNSRSWERAGLLGVTGRNRVGVRCKDGPKRTCHEWPPCCHFRFQSFQCSGAARVLKLRELACHSSCNNKGVSASPYWWS